MTDKRTLKLLAVTAEDRKMVADYFAQTGTGNPNATCPEMEERMSGGDMDEMPMLQLVAFIRERGAKQ